MDSLDLFMENPGMFWFWAILSLLWTLVLYGSYPLLYASFQKEPITARKYRWTCFLINQILRFFLFFLSDSNSLSPCLLWTVVFTAVGTGKLERKGLLIDPNAPPEELPQSTEEPTEPQPAEAPAEPRYTAPAVEVQPAAPVAEPRPAAPAGKHTGKFQQPALVRKKSKQRYCRHCGSPLDPSTKQCTGCGRRPFRQTLRRFFSCLTLILSITIVCLCLFQTRQYRDQITRLTAQIDEQHEELQSLQSQLDSATAELESQKAAWGSSKIDVTELQDKYRKKFNEAYDLSKELEEIKPIYDLCKKNLVFVTKEGIYHKLGCLECVFVDYYIAVYTADEASQKGYDPCKWCMD